MKAKSFIEVLEEQIRLDLRKEIEAEVRASFAKEMANEARGPEPQTTAPSSPKERLDGWLSVHLKRFSFQHQAASSPYPRRTPPPTPQGSKSPETSPPQQASPPRSQAQTFEELCALELLRRHSGGKLPECFSEAELKSAWRHAALKTHPDRHIGENHSVQAQAAALFRELQLAYTVLSETFIAHREAKKAA